MKKTCDNCRLRASGFSGDCVPFLNKKCYNPEISHHPLSGECWAMEDAEKSCDNCVNYENNICTRYEYCSPNYSGWEPKEKEKNDNVNHPSHYKQYETETIDIIKSCLTHEQYKGYLLGNMLKYRLRAGWKGDRDEDLKKSNVYQDWLKGEEDE